MQVTYKQMIGNNAPASLHDVIMGELAKGVFTPFGSVAEGFFLKQRQLINDKPKQSKTNIYFIQPINGGLVKIGSAKNIQDRFKSLQTGSPVILKIIKTIKDVSYDYEFNLHRRFKEYRKHGEWFDAKVLKEEI